MGIVYGFLIVLEALLSALLIAIIFMQRTKGGMGGTAFGGGAGEAIFGSRMGNVLTKATVVLGSVFLLNTIVLTILTARREPGGSVMDSVDIPMPVQQQPMMPESMPAASMPVPSAPVEIPAPVVDVPSAPVEIPAPVVDVPAIPAVESPAPEVAQEAPVQE